MYKISCKFNLEAVFSFPVTKAAQLNLPVVIGSFPNEMRNCCWVKKVNEQWKTDREIISKLEKNKPKRKILFIFPRLVLGSDIY